MFIGHYASAYVARRFFPEVPLWALFVAAQAPDVLFFGLSAAGLEAFSIDVSRPPAIRLIAEHVVYSHSLFGTGLLAALVAALGVVAGRQKMGIALGLVILSHWFFDVFVHPPSLPIGFTELPVAGLAFGVLPTFSLVVELGGMACGYAWLRDGGAPGLDTRWLPAGVAFLFIIGLADRYVLPYPESQLGLALGAAAVFIIATVLAGWAEQPEEADGQNSEA